MVITIGNIQKKAVVVDDEVKIRNVVNVSITLDHRYTDGSTAAPLYKKFISVLKDPEKFIPFSNDDKKP